MTSFPFRRAARGTTLLLSLLLLSAGAAFAQAGGPYGDALEADIPQAEVVLSTSTTAAAGSVPTWNGYPLPDPMIALYPDGVEPDRAYWLQHAKRESAARRARMMAERGSELAARLTLSESEPNNGPRNANFLDGFGTAPGFDPSADVSGSIPAGPAPLLVAAAGEDEGSIPLTTVTGLDSGESLRSEGTIGDGPYGSSGSGSGDYDFYRVSGLEPGQVLAVEVGSTGALSPFIGIYNEGGGLLAIADAAAAGGSAFLQHLVLAAGDYYVSVGSSTSPFPADPFDPASGPFGVGSEGDYTATFSLDYLESDFYSMRLRKGDVFAANLMGAAGTLILREANGRVRTGSSQDVTYIHPPTSPIPGGGSSAVAYVIPKPGIYTLEVIGTQAGDYTLEARVFRPALRSAEAGAKQRIFLDFDGATLNAEAIWGVGNNPAVLSPMVDFLPLWGIDPANEDLVIDFVVGRIRDAVDDYVARNGRNGDYETTGIPGEFDVEILNSRDHADPFGEPNVSRIIIGGTVPELGIPTVGLAQSIDPGNFVSAETGAVLLDLVSGPKDAYSSFNNFEVAPGSSWEEFVGISIGNIAAHEIGHYLGNFHTEQFVTRPTMMDQGGNIANTIGIGADGIYGTADDVVVQFGVDRYAPNEVYLGRGDSLNTTAFACSTPEADTVIIDGCDSGVANGFLDNLVQLSEGIGVCAAQTERHGQFVGCTAAFLGRARGDGVLTGPERADILECAREAEIP